MQGYCFIYQLLVVTSLQFTKTSKCNEQVFGRCDARVKGEEKQF